MKRQMLAIALGLLVALSVSAPALAHVCSNQNKNPYAGAVGIVMLDVATGVETFEPLKENGNFIAIIVILPDGSEQAFSIFLHATPQGELPDTAQLAGPGDDYCDYKGIDNAETCFEELLAAIE